MRNRSFFEVIADSISTFMSAFFGLIATWWFLIAIIAVGVFVAAKFGVSSQQIKTFTTASIYSGKYQMLGALAFNYFYFVFIMWQINVISNKISFAECRLISSLGRAFIKSPKVIIGTVIMSIAMAIIVIPTAMILPKYVASKTAAFIIIYAVELLIMPFIFCAFMGLILQDGKFLEIMGRSFKIAGTSYFTLICNLIYIVISTILFGVACFLLIMIFKMFGIIMCIILTPLLMSYCLCYSIEAYFNCLDRQEIKEEGPLAAQEETFKLEEKQEVYLNTIPDGMRPLGSSYQEEPQKINNIAPQNNQGNDNKPLAK